MSYYYATRNFMCVDARKENDMKEVKDSIAACQRSCNGNDNQNDKTEIFSFITVTVLEKNVSEIRIKNKRPS